jgi:hypothetical protein
MLGSFARAAILFLTLTGGNGIAVAGDLADFNAAAETVASHNRVVLGYLRTGNKDLASVELDRLRVGWTALGKRFADKRPEVFDGNTYYVVAMTDISTRLITADLMLNSGHADVARDALLAVREDLHKLRLSAGIEVLADCIYDANAVMNELMVYNDRTLDWTKSGTRFGVANKASIYGYVLDRCDSMASEDVRKSPEFRRLIDGARAGLALIPKAIATRDADLLHRILIELRSFDNLLAFRFG